MRLLLYGNCVPSGNLRNPDMTTPNLLSAKYRANQLADSILLAYWANSDGDKAYHMANVRQSFDDLTKAMNGEVSR